MDFKALPCEDSFEIAKDVAALANAEGGTLLVGAKGKGEYLASYAPLTIADASLAQRTYEQAVRDRCAPAPLFDVTSIPKEGGFVLAVNVWPFPGQPVGVEVKQGEARCGSAGTQPQGLFYFPTRVGTHTKAITPEQMPMFMDARARRVAIALDQAVGQTITLSSSKYRLKGIFRESAKVESVDVLGNSVTLIVRSGADDVPLSLPFDVVDAIWRAADGWQMIIRGGVETISGSPNKLIFNPDPN